MAADTGGNAGHGNGRKSGPKRLRRPAAAKHLALLEKFSAGLVTLPAEKRRSNELPILLSYAKLFFGDNIPLITNHLSTILGEFSAMLKQFAYDASRIISWVLSPWILTSLPLTLLSWFSFREVSLIDIDHGHLNGTLSAIADEFLHFTKTSNHSTQDNRSLLDSYIEKRVHLARAKIQLLEDQGIKVNLK